MKRGIFIGVLVALALSATVAGASNTKPQPTLDVRKFCATVEAHGNRDTLGDLTMIRKKGHKRFCTPGPRGARGGQGERGPAAPQGLQGTPAPSTKGWGGAPGGKGDAGAQGPAGSVGPAGP